MKKLFTLVAILIVVGNAALAQGTVPDPMSIGVGARALGMGRAFVGMAEDGDALFMNPAGLAQSGTPRLSSMYSSLMNDVSYTVIGDVYPYGEHTAVGAGVINAHTGDITLSNSDGSSAGSGQWGNSVMFLSAGTYLNNMAPFKGLDRDVLVGGSFKYFSTGGSGANDVANLADAAGTGYSADLGVLYPATDYLTLGVNYQNVLASRLTRSTGINETIPANLKVGVKMNVIGSDNKAYTTHAVRRLYLNADYDCNALNSVDASHIGLEFWPTGNLALRAGADGTNPTAGIGLRLAGLEFNYAYHPFSNINDSATSFFSISYLGESLKRQLRVVLDSPNDKAIIYDDHVKVSGRVIVEPGDGSEPPTGPLTVKVNGVVVAAATDNTFSADVPVEKVGKKLLAVEVSDAAGDYVKQDFRVLRLINFADVPEGYWAKRPIEDTGTVGLVEGYPDGTFQPDRALTRAELATLLVRAKGLKLPDRQANKVFKDVSPNYWAAKYIEVAKREGLIKGYPDGTFRSNNKINKAEGIAIVVRFENLKVAYEVYEKPYWDVSANHWAARYIQAAKEAGMLKYISKNYLKPKDNLARAESVEMLSRTTLAGNEIRDLYTWERGFQRENIQQEKPTLRGAVPAGNLQAAK